MEFKLLAALEPAVRQEVLATSSRRRFSKGMVLFHEGDPGDSLHLVAKGRVAVRVGTESGETALLAILGVGDAFGEQALLDEHARRTATVAAIEPTETLVLQRADVDALRQRYPGVDRLLVAQLAAQVRRLSTHLGEALYLSAEKRVMRRMLELHDVFEGAEVPLTQEDVATMAGTTRPTVNRVLQRLAEAGEVGVGRGSFTILDRPALARHAR